MKALKILNVLLIFTILLGCSKDEAIEEPQLSSEKQITSYQFLLSENPFDVNVVGNINEGNKTISFNVPDGAEINALLPNIQVSPTATYAPQGIQDFSEPIVYTVTAEDGSIATYKLTPLLTERDILLSIYNVNPNNTLEWDLDSEDISIWDGVILNDEQRVVSLFISDKNIEVLPHGIGQLESLTQLSLYRNNLTVLPLEIWQLSNLTTLILSNNNLTIIPSGIGQLISLNQLQIGGNNITELPTEIGQLTNLTFLIVNNNNLTEIPSEIWQLTNLSVLYINNNNLTEISSDISNLVNLEYLLLSDNSLSEIPIELGQLTELTYMWLSNNTLTAIPEEIGQLVDLTYLSLHDNQLTEIPSTIGGLIQLQDLSLSNNNLTSIPQAVCDLETNHGTNISLDAGVICE